MKLIHYIIVATAIILAAIFAIANLTPSESASLNIDQKNVDESLQTSLESSAKIMVMIDLPANRVRSNSGYSAGYGDARQKAIRARLGRNIAKEYGLKFIDNWPMPQIDVECFIMEVPDKMTIEDIVTTLSNDKRVNWVEPMADYDTQSAIQSYNDPLYPVSPAAQRWDLASLHSQYTGRNISIAVIDTQVDTKHPDLIGRVSVVKNFTNFPVRNAELHGTGVAGVIAAKANNGIGMAGIAPNAKILGLRACWQNNKTNRSNCNTLSLARALNYATEQNVDIINLSLGGPPSKLLTQLIDTAAKRNIAIVAAYNEKLPSGGFPASHKQVIAVSSDGESFTMSRGFKAPGNDIPTTRPGGTWYLADGSSFAAAHVSGLLALMQQCRKIASRNCRNIATQSGSRFIIDAKASLR